jgi:hypothetical protein
VPHLFGGLGDALIPDDASAVNEGIDAPVLAEHFGGQFHATCTNTKR